MGFNAAQLPYEILVECFEAARCQDLVHGGELVRWASNEAVAPFALVCKAWANRKSVKPRFTACLILSVVLWSTSRSLN